MIPSTALKSVGTTVPARFLGEPAFRAGRIDNPSHGAGEAELLRHALARWMTSEDNPLFAQATVNRTWAHFFGRGLVNPVDDLRTDNRPSHPAVLDLLAADLKHSGFDQKHLARCICLSQTYQRASQPPGGKEHDDTNYGHRTVKVLSPGVLYDSLTATTGLRELRLGLPQRTSKQGVTTAITPRAAFVSFFRSQDEEAVATDYHHGIPQALKLLNAAPLSGVAPVVQRLAQTGLSRDRAIEQLYLTALARRPSAEETRILHEYLDRKDASLEQGYSTVLWTLINSSEFVLNQ